MSDLSLEERSVISKSAVKLKSSLITSLRLGRVIGGHGGRHLLPSVRAFWNLEHETRHAHS